MLVSSPTPTQIRMTSRVPSTTFEDASLSVVGAHSGTAHTCTYPRSPYSPPRPTLVIPEDILRLRGVDHTPLFESKTLTFPRTDATSSAPAASETHSGPVVVLSDPESLCTSPRLSVKSPPLSSYHTRKEGRVHMAQQSRTTRKRKLNDHHHHRHSPTVLPETTGLSVVHLPCGDVGSACGVEDTTSAKKSKYCSCLF
jgi:hypothetical protein